MGKKSANLEETVRRVKKNKFRSKKTLTKSINEINCTKEKQEEEKRRLLEKKSRFEMTKKYHTETYEEAKKIGRLDEDFINLCDFIAKTKNYFTSSSCAGRITLISLGEGEEKKESAFYRKWHRTVTEDEVIQAVVKFNGRVLWFKQEPLILHLGTNTIENARIILKLCERSGIKRAGIKVAKEGKFIVELLGTQNLAVPIKEGKIKVKEDYLKYLIKKANEKFKKNQELILRLEKEARKMLK